MEKKSMCFIPTIYATQWTHETLLYKYTSLILFSKGGPQFVVSWEMDGETYTRREDFFFPYLLPGSRGYQCLHPLASSSETTSDRLRVPRSTMILCTLTKSDPVVLITWSPSGYTPVVPDYPDVLSYPCLLITAIQLVKAHGVRWNEPKIHVICYITYANILLGRSNDACK